MIFLAVGACENETTAPADTAVAGGGGSGNGALQVQVYLTVENRTANASEPDEFDTYLSVVVQRADSRVVDAIVTLGRADVAEPQVLQPDDQQRYNGDHVGYCPTYTLDVQSGLDSVLGVSIRVPAPHQVTAPADGSSWSAGQDLDVRWQEAEPVDWIELHWGSIQTPQQDDAGTLTLSAATLQAAVSAGTLTDRLTVLRGIRFALEGGAAGSRAFVAVKNGLQRVTLTP